MNYRFVESFISALTLGNDVWKDFAFCFESPPYKMPHETRGQRPLLTELLVPTEAAPLVPGSL